MGVEQCFYLQWHEHKRSLITAFEKHFEKNNFVDCTLAAEGQYLNVHKIILTACSPYFETLLNQSNDKHPIIILKDVKFRELKAIVEYMYRGETNITPTAIKDFLSAAANLQIKGLEKHGKGESEVMSIQERKEFVDTLPASSSTEFLRSFIDHDQWIYTGRSSLSESTGDSVTYNNGLEFNKGTERNGAIVPSTLSGRIMPTITGTGEGDAEVMWLQNETLTEEKPSDTNVLPSGITSVSTRPIKSASQECLEKKQDPVIFCIPTQGEPIFRADGDGDVKLKTEAPIPVEEAETESIISSVVELSDTTEEWAETEVDDEQTPSPPQSIALQTTAKDKESSRQREETDKEPVKKQGLVTSQERSTENEQLGNSSSLSSSTSSSSSSDSLSTLRPTSTSTTEANTKSSEMCLPHEDRKASAPKTGGEMNDAQVFLSTPLLQKRQIYCRSSKEFQHPTGHMEIQMWTNSKEMPFRCLICDYSTFDLHLLKTHQRTHFGDRPFKCQECDTAFTPTCCLQRHQWRFAGERLFKCQNCEFISGDCRSLQEHRCTRAAERPFRCSGTREAIKVQGETNYKERGAAKVYYKCEFCDAAFRSSFKLVKHKRLHVGAYCTEER